jgi:dipeptidyl aminopeptidase/acylaminoacyl peptidase
MYRTRFKKDILTEFLPPARKTKKQRVIIFCDGMPSNPRKQPLCRFLSKQGFWVFYPRYRGAWESGGEFLDKSPDTDIRDIIDEIPKGFTESAFKQKFTCSPDEIFVIGGSFGGCTALLASLDARVKKVIANCPVTDWSILKNYDNKETSNKSYTAYIRESFGNGYRLSAKNWWKLYGEKFFNPMYYAKEIDGKKIMLFHAKDDPYVPYKTVVKFAKKTGAKLYLYQRGGHLSSDKIVKKYWERIKKFFEH